MTDEDDRYEWVNVSSGTGSPRLCVCVCVHLMQYMLLVIFSITLLQYLKVMVVTKAPVEHSKGAHLSN